MREGGVRMREIVDCLGYTDPSGAYAGLNYLHAMRAQDQKLDAEISALENMRTEHQGPEPNIPTLQSAHTLPHEPNV